MSQLIHLLFKSLSIYYFLFRYNSNNFLQIIFLAFLCKQKNLSKFILPKRLVYKKKKYFSLLYLVSILQFRLFTPNKPFI